MFDDINGEEQVAPSPPEPSSQRKPEWQPSYTMGTSIMGYSPTRQLASMGYGHSGGSDA